MSESQDLEDNQIYSSAMAVVPTHRQYLPRGGTRVAERAPRDNSERLLRGAACRDVKVLLGLALVSLLAAGEGLSSDASPGSFDTGNCMPADDDCALRGKPGLDQGGPSTRDQAPAESSPVGDESLEQNPRPVASIEEGEKKHSHNRSKCRESCRRAAR